MMRSIKNRIVTQLTLVWRFIIIRGFGRRHAVNELLALSKPFHRT
jgi:hypothetical protein